MLNSHWVVALTEIKLCYIGTSKIIKDLCVYSNVCKDTIVEQSETSLLRRIHINKDSTNQIKIKKEIDHDNQFNFRHAILRPRSYRRTRSDPRLYKERTWSGMLISQSSSLCGTSFQEVSAYSIMPGKFYVSDPKLWEQTFKDMVSGILNPHQYARSPQTGRGLGERYTSSWYIV